MNEKLNVICFTPNGGKIANELYGKLNTKEIKCFYKSTEVIQDCERIESLNDFTKTCFNEGVALVVIGAAGIASRMIAPFVKDKLEDIPVIVVDELGTFVIPILSGHVGGANELASEIAGALEAVPVITTATDINNKFSIDSYAAKHNLTIVNKDGIKQVSKKILQDRPIRVCIEKFHRDNSSMLADVLISDNPDNKNITDTTLVLKPKKYIMGVGTRKGKSYEELSEFVGEVLEANSISKKDILAVTSIDRKIDEEGIIKLAASLKVPYITFDAETLLEVKGEFTASDFVKETVGVDNVCERSALCAAGAKGKLIINKTTRNGMSLAVACKG